MNISKISELFNNLLDPRLWSLPFIFLFLINLYAILGGGLSAQTPLVTYKGYNAVNGILFSSLALWSIYSYTKRGVDRFNVLFLSFATVLACFGTGEVINRIFFTPRYLAEYGFYNWVFTWFYPIFFISMNAAIFRELKPTAPIIIRFLFMLMPVVFFYAVYRLVMWHFVDVLGITSAVDIVAYGTYQYPYYAARVFSILAYASLVKHDKI